MFRTHHLPSLRLLLATALLPAPLVSGSDPFEVREARIDANRLAGPLQNVGSFGYGLTPETADLEFPRGSGKRIFLPLGLWIGANLGGVREGAIYDFVGETRPGPMIGGTYALFDTTYKVYKVARSDTTGWAEWMAHAVPLGAPTDSAGTAPGVLGSQTLWNVYNDADPAQHRMEFGLQPLGVEVRQTTWAFKEKGPRDDVILFRWRIENRGTQTLDSVYVGVWADPDVGDGHANHFGSDSALAMAYSYPLRASFVYGDSTPAFGLRLLEGARATPSGSDLGATSINPYFHGLEPMTSFEHGNLLRGLETDGSTLIDPTTGQPSVYRYSGDPFTGTGWLDTLDADMRVLVTSGPFTMAPGDTQQITAAIVLGWGPENASSLDSLYSNAQNADFFGPPGEEYADPEPPIPNPSPGIVLRTNPNPTSGAVQFSFRAPSGASYRLSIYDVRGRSLGTLDQGIGDGNTVSFTWASPYVALPAIGQTRGTFWPGAGIVFAVLDVDGRRTTQRIAIIGN